MFDYMIKVANLGASEVTLTNAWPTGPVETELNRPQRFVFAMDVLDPQAALCVPLAREINVYRNTTRIFAGPIVNAHVEADTATVTFECDGLLAYFAHRNIDSGADRTNFLSNPEFEDNVTGWTAVNTTATAVTSQRILGLKSAQLVQSTALQDAYLKQDVAIVGTGVGSLYTIVAWFKIDPTAWIGEAIGGRGLTLSRIVGGDIQQSGDFYIDGDTPRGSWQRAETTVWVPPNASETLQVRLYSPGGTIWWDAASLTLMESLASAEAGDDFLMDQTKIAKRIAEFVQDPTFGKDNVGILTDCPLSGVERERHYQFADHTNALQALVEFTEMENGFDIEVDPADRTFRTHYPFKGADRTGTVTLTPPAAADDSDQCLLQRWRYAGDQAASGVVVLGEGDGPDREEGGAADPTAFDGRTIELVTTPRATAAIDTLDEIASRELVDRLRPEIVEIAVLDPTFVALLKTGDVVTVTVDWGIVQCSGAWRITRTAEDLAAGTLQVTLRPMP
ncbi:MAG TPA: hypothetical protein VM345_01905 [Acidimicrobiales bacterium]|nr:hypothetical protein [Acidimicrobiales bacterium]